MKCTFVYTQKCNDNQLFMRESAECRQNRIFNLLLVRHELAHTIRSKAVRQVLYVCKNENTLDLV